MMRFQVWRSTLITVSILILYSVEKLYAQQSFPKLNNVRDFADYLQQSGKQYNDPNEYRYRESLFASKKSAADIVNANAAAGTSPFNMAINPLADRSKEEVGRMTASKLSFLGEGITGRHENFVEPDIPVGQLPESFDWREKGGVTPAKFQGFDCGSCWSFSAIGALEGHLFRRTGILVPLSEQNLVDCTDEYGSEGCDGGFPDYAFEYIRDKGVTLANKYPYTQMQNQQCLLNNATTSIVRIRNYANIRPGNEQKMKQIIATLGPLACSMNAGPVSFEQYGGGIYNDEECNNDEVNHSIVVVGYGVENGQEYWIIKNSYSANWGENGFMRLARNQNLCGIASECSYPVL